MLKRCASIGVALVAALVLAARSTSADPIGVVVDKTGDGLVVTVNQEAANIHFTYATQCDTNKPCYQITAGQGMVGIPASASGCKVQQGNANTPTGIQCDANVGSIQFNMMNGGTWSAYEGGGGQHTAGPCAPAKIIVKASGGVTSINTWNGCHEVVFCDSGSKGMTVVEADATDDISGKCGSVVKH